MVGTVTIDLSKAFDKGSHSILHKKLQCYGVRAGELCWFDGFLNGRKQKVCMVMCNLTGVTSKQESHRDQSLVHCSPVYE